MEGRTGVTLNAPAIVMAGHKKGHNSVKSLRMTPNLNFYDALPICKILKKLLNPVKSY